MADKLGLILSGALVSALGLSIGVKKLHEIQGHIYLPKTCITETRIALKSPSSQRYDRVSHSYRATNFGSYVEHNRPITAEEQTEVARILTERR
jgi:hypothetical protein